MSDVINNVPELRFSEFSRGWSSLEVLDVAKVYDGTHQTPKYVEQGVPFYSVEHVTANQFSETKYISEEVYEKENKRVKLEKGDILMTRIGSIGNAKYIDWDVRASFYVSLALFKVFDSINSKFLSQLINSPEFQRELWKRTIHVAFPQKINLGEISHCKLSVPNLEEQQKIADFLSSVDKKIEQLTEKHRLLTEYKKGVMQQIFTQQIRFKDSQGNDYPEWSEKKIGNYLVKHEEKTVVNNQYPVLTSSRKGIFLQKDYFDGQDVASKDNTGYNVVPRGFFTYRHMSDDLIFKFNINDIVDKGIVSTLYPVFTTKNIDDYFLRTLLNEGREFQRYAILQKQGGSRTYMYFKKLQGLEVSLPCIEEQQKIANFLTEIDQKIDQAWSILEQTKAFKKGLLQKMFV